MNEKKLAKITNDTLSAVQNIFERKLDHLKLEDAVEVMRRVARLIDPEKEPPKS